MALAQTPQRPVLRQPRQRPVIGRARLGRSTKLLARRLAAGDVAIVDHAALDRVSAEELVAARVAAVINCACSISDSYPNTGPLVLVGAGIKLVDVPGDALFERCREGDLLEVSVMGEVLRSGELLAVGRALGSDELEALTLARGAEVGAALERFALNTIEHMRAERELPTSEPALPALATDFRDRPVLVVSRGSGYLDDLRALGTYVRDARPVIVAVDGAVDGVLDAGFRPEVIVGDMDSASDRALGCGAELVAHAYLDGRAPGRDRLAQLGLRHTVARAPGTSADLAMLLAAGKGAAQIVSVGSRLSLVDFLDRDRDGASSTFLTRLAIGEILVDAAGIARLSGSRRARDSRRSHARAGVVVGLAAVALGVALWALLAP